MCERRGVNGVRTNITSTIITFNRFLYFSFALGSHEIDLDDCRKCVYFIKLVIHYLLSGVPLAPRCACDCAIYAIGMIMIASNDVRRRQISIWNECWSIDLLMRCNWLFLVHLIILIISIWWYYHYFVLCFVEDSDRWCCQMIDWNKGWYHRKRILLVDSFSFAFNWIQNYSSFFLLNKSSQEKAILWRRITHRIVWPSVFSYHSPAHPHSHWSHTANRPRTTIAKADL